MNDMTPSPALPAAAGVPLRKGSLAAIVGLFAASSLLTLTPAEESGRKVEVTMQQDGTATMRHVSGKQYLRAYLDIVGVPTICDGLTKGVRLGQQRTEAQCAAALEAELAASAAEVKRCTPAIFKPGTEHQRIAAVLLAHNIGWPSWCRSTADRLFDEGKPRLACEWFLPWNKGTVPAAQVPAYRARGESCTRTSAGVWKCTIRGLTGRRERERAICVTGLGR